MTDNTNSAPNTAGRGPEPIVITPTPKAKRSRKGWVLGGVLAVAGLASFGAIQAFPQSFGPGFHGFGPGHHMRGASFDPARMAQRVDFGADIILGRVGANEEQRRKISDLIKANLKEVPALREQHLAARNRVIELLKAEKFDKAELERVRAQELALAEQISKRLVQSVGEAADILTPKQRQDLVSLWERRPGWR